MRLIHTAMLACVGATMVTALACSSSDGDGDPGGGAPESGSQTGEATSTPTRMAATAASASAKATAAASPRPGATRSTGQSAEGRSALSQSLDRLSQTNYHVVYRIEGTEDGELFEGKFALGAKGEKSVFLMEIGSPEGSFILATVYDGEKNYFCLGGNDPEQPDEPTAACYESDDDDGPSREDFPFLNFEEELRRMAADGEAEVIAIDDRRIGNRDAKCYQVTDDSGTGVACVSKAEGFLVLVDGEFEGSAIYMELESYTDNPPDTVFTPPYPVEEFSLEAD